MRGLRHLAVLVVIALVANACGSQATDAQATASPAGTSVTQAAPSPSSQASTQAEPTPGAPAPTPGPLADPVALAEDITNATSHEDRVAALTRMMGALHIGVYAPDGTAISQGTERSGLDFFVYDFEIDGLAMAVDSGAVRTLPQLTMQLNEIVTRMQLTSPEPITDDLVTRSLHEAVVAAMAAPEDSSSYHLRLLRELTIRGPLVVDLAGDIDPSTEIAFGAPAFFLLLSDLLLPIIYEGDAPTAGHGGVTAAAGFGVMTAGIPCDVPGSGQIGKVISSIKWAAWLRDTVGDAVKKGGVKSADVIRLVTVSIESLHGVMIAATVWADRIGAEFQESHYGHDQPGKKLEFTIRVANFKDYPEALVKCGWLAGLKFPPKGPIDDILVTWSNGPQVGGTFTGGGSRLWTSSLEDHGTVTCPTQGCSVTAGGGRATLTFDPKDEAFPLRIGKRDYDKGWVRAWPWINLSLGNTSVGVVGGDLVTPKRVYWDWKVGWHEVPVLTLHIRSEVVLHGPIGVSNASGTVQLRWVPDPSDPNDPKSGWFEGQGTLNVRTTGPAPTPCSLPVLANRQSTADVMIRKLRFNAASGPGAIEGRITIGQSPTSDTMIVPRCKQVAERRQDTVIWAGFVIGDRVSQGEAGGDYAMKDWTVSSVATSTDRFPGGEVARTEWMGTCQGTCNTITEFKLEAPDVTGVGG